MRVRIVALIVVAVSVTLALSACRPSPTGTPSGGQSSVQASPSSPDPTMVPGPGGVATATPPTDPDAIALAREWIAAAAPPPGVRILASAPPSGPEQPATSAGCNWLVQATKWWSTDSSNVVAASAWLTRHPVEGLTFSGTMAGGDGQSAIFEGSAQKQGTLEFEFVPDGESVTIRVYVILIPAGAECASAGGTAAGSPAPRVRS